MILTVNSDSAHPYSYKTHFSKSASCAVLYTTDFYKAPELCGLARCSFFYLDEVLRFYNLKKMELCGSSLQLQIAISRRLKNYINFKKNVNIEVIFVIFVGGAICSRICCNSYPTCILQLKFSKPSTAPWQRLLRFLCYKWYAAPPTRHFRLQNLSGSLLLAALKIAKLIYSHPA